MIRIFILIICLFIAIKQAFADCTTQYVKDTNGNNTGTIIISCGAITCFSYGAWTKTVQCYKSDGSNAPVSPGVKS